MAVGATSRPWLLWKALLVGIPVGAVVGIGGFTFVYARGASYLSNDPAACANCHVMQEQYDGWTRASHHAVAGCNDCHTPHDFAGKWFTKALNGFNHSWAFTTGNFAEPIRITPRNAEITEGTCRSCHVSVVASIDAHAEPGTADALDCTRCHESVGHLH